MGPLVPSSIEVAVGPVSLRDLSDERIRVLPSSAFSAGFKIPQPMVDEFRGVDPRVFAATSQAIRAAW